MKLPITHISSLATTSHLCIQMVEPGLLIDCLDGSTDLRADLGDTMHDDFMTLLDRKFNRCSEWFNTNLATLGIQEPLVVIIYPNGEWVIDDGHHRLAWALLNEISEIPVVFDDTGAGDESYMASVVARVDVTAYHNTTNEELVAEAEARLVEETMHYMADVTVPMPVVPRMVARHRNVGRHRAG
jgi:hypothetical protein